MSAVLRLVAALVAAWPWRALALPGRLLGWLAGSVLRIRRSGVVAAMRRAGVADPASAASAMYASLGIGILELLWLAGASVTRRRRALDREVVGIDEALREAVLAGPVVLAASHTGNWELAAQAAAAVLADQGRGRRLVVVAKPMSVGAFDVFTRRLREAGGLELVEPRGAFGRVRAALARGDVVVMPIDQVPDARRHGRRVPFLGAPALADRAPATLALRAGVPLLVVAGSRNRGGTHRLELLAALRPEQGRRGVDEATERATAALDGFVRSHPSQWLWLHRRWREPAPAAVRLVASPHPG